MNPHRAVCFLTRFALTGRCQGVMVKNNTTAPPAWGDAVKNLNQGQWYSDRNARRWIYTDLNVLLQQLKYDSVPAGNICMSEAITSAFRAMHLQSINLFISLWIAVSGYFFCNRDRKQMLYTALYHGSVCAPTLGFSDHIILSLIYEFSVIGFGLQHIKQKDILKVTETLWCILWIILCIPVFIALKNVSDFKKCHLFNRKTSQFSVSMATKTTFF